MLLCPVLISNHKPHAMNDGVTISCDVVKKRSQAPTPKLYDNMFFLDVCRKNCVKQIEVDLTTLSATKLTAQHSVSFQSNYEID